jgi:type IV fimbrial biogenesis protein FimT
MPYDYQSILSLMNVVLVACAGVTAIGLYRILKAFGCIPWGVSKSTQNKELEIDMILSSMPEVTYTAYIPGKETKNEILSSLPKVTGFTNAGGYKMSNSKGFTMMELLIVIVIFGIVTAMAVPNFLGWMSNYNLRAAADELFSNMQYARLNAVKDNSEWALVFDTTNGIYYVCSDNGDGDWTTMDAGQIQATERTVTLTDYAADIAYGMGNATKNVTVTGGAFPNGAVFGARGTCGSEGYIYLTNSRGTAYAVGAGLGGVIIYRQWMDTDWG